MRVPWASHLGQAFDLSDALLKAGLWDEINDVLQASGLACGSSAPGSVDFKRLGGAGAVYSGLRELGGAGGRCRHAPRERFFVLGLRGDASRLLKRKPPCQDLRPAAAKISEEAKAEIQGRARRPRDKAPDKIKIRAVSLT